MLLTLSAALCNTDNALLVCFDLFTFAGHNLTACNQRKNYPIYLFWVHIKMMSRVEAYTRSVIVFSAHVLVYVHVRIPLVPPRPIGSCPVVQSPSTTGRALKMIRLKIIYIGRDQVGSRLVQISTFAACPFVFLNAVVVLLLAFW